MNLSVVILAAGLGKRMKSDKPKVLHEVLGRPMLQHVIDAVKPLKPSRIAIVIGNGAETVKQQINEKGISFVLQKQLLGTGDAVLAARNHIKKGTVLVLNGDGPLITTKTLRGFLTKHKRHKNTVSFLSFLDNSLSGYGRVFRDSEGKVTGIVEDKHASPEERIKFNELNSGVYLIESAAIGYLNSIKKNSSSGEYYLTDLVKLTADAGKKVNTYLCPPEETRGVNSRRELFEISAIMREKIISKWLDKGVTFIDPDTTVIHSTVSIGKDTIIYPNTYFEGNTSVGKNCIIYPGARICDSSLGDNVVVKDSTLIEDSKIGKNASVGPFAHVRPGCDVGQNSKIGNFVELKKTRLGKGAKASHLSYLGDAQIGSDVNIGAGTITCNYDGKNKFQTNIESGVFIGSDSQLVAPVTIGKGSYVAAGATITKDVPSGALAISRTRQKNLESWVSKNTKVKAGKKGK
jgi:bifunctional UDP-N-acetylglucosamine pyrophosphorylase/glucosamine-1-phosphate N-acetyltransferase